MQQSISFNIANLSAKELDDIALNNEGVVGILFKDSPFEKCNTHELTLEGGWLAYWVDRDRHSKLIIRPNSKDSHAVVYREFSNLCLANGISDTLYIKELFNLRLPYKRELIQCKAVKAALSHEVLMTRLIMYDTFDSQSEWIDATPFLPDVIRVLSHARLMSLMTICEKLWRLR